MPQQKRPAVPHRPFPHKRDTLERILQSNAHAIGILIHFIDDLLSPRSLIQVEAHIRGLDGEFQIFINLVAGVRIQFPRVVGRGEIGYGPSMREGYEAMFAALGIAELLVPW